jgi:hypothetical protein
VATVKGKIRTRPTNEENAPITIFIFSIFPLFVPDVQYPMNDQSDQQNFQGN